jgi:hypothetical protein
MDWNFVIWSLVKIVAVIFLASCHRRLRGPRGAQDLGMDSGSRRPNRTAPPCSPKIPILGRSS